MSYIVLTRVEMKTHWCPMNCINISLRSRYATKIDFNTLTHVKSTFISNTVFPILETVG